MKNIRNFVLILALGLFLAGCKTVEKFTVTFMNGDAEVVSVEVKKGKDATAPENPSKAGFTFTGWDKGFTSVDEDLVVNAVFTVKTFNVQFRVDGEVYGEAVVVKYGEDAVMPAAPEKEGYVFLAWDKEAKNVTENLVVNATFEDATYSVAFRVDGVQVGETQTITHGEAAVAPTSPVKTGHTFTGWDKEFAVVTGDLIVSAEFDALTYTVRFYLDENNLIGAAQTVAYGQAATAPTAPEQVGFAFDKWDKAFNNITGDLEVTAIYVVATFTVKFMFDGVQVGADQVLEYGEDAVAPASPPKLGYNFTGWSIAFANVTANLTVVAEFSLLTYEIKYFDGTNELIHSPATYNVEDTFEFSEYVKTGFLFVGWFDSGVFGGTSLDGIVIGSTGNVSVNGKWLDESKTYDVNFTLNDGAWTWTTGTVVPESGINNVSNLPKIFMQDFYTYLKDNDLLEASTVHSTLRKTTWAEFSVLGGDPFALYNKTSTNVASTPDGYSQFFYTLNSENDVTGGFFGTEPYKTKYVNLLSMISYMFPIRYSGSNINAENGKALVGFIIDGYFYGTQGPSTGDFLELRKVIPNTNLKYFIENGVAVNTDVTYPILNYIQGLEYILPMPSREGFFFGGWYDNGTFTGDKVLLIAADVAPSAMYFAKWIAV